jgi:hypothetical protein
MQSADSAQDSAVTDGGGTEQKGRDSGPELGTALGSYFVTLVTLFGSLVLVLGTALHIVGLPTNRSKSSCEDGAPPVERRPELAPPVERRPELPVSSTPNRAARTMPVPTQEVLL